MSYIIICLKCGKKTVYRDPLIIFGFLDDWARAWSNKKANEYVTDCWNCKKEAK